MDNMLVTAIGEVLWDIFPDGARFGGAPANVVSHVAGLGGKAAMVSSVGDDDYGRRALAELRQRGILVDCVGIVDRLPTGVVNVELDGGKPSFTIQQPAAWDELRWSDEVEELVHLCDAVCFGTLGQRNEVARGVIERFVKSAPSRALRVCDVNLRPPFFSPDMIRHSLEWANVLKLSDEELETVAAAVDCKGSDNEILGELLDNWGLHVIAVTRGSDGATLLSNDERSDCHGVPVEVQDTVGAGDAFTATLISGLLHGATLDDINRRACKVASFVCSQSGATPELPEELKTNWN